MAEVFDPYRVWLGLPEMAGKPSYYQLLGVPDGEPDLERIAIAADRAATKVRSFRPGANAAAWSRLLDEIHAAKTCLLEPASKDEYDRQTRSAASAASPESVGASTSPRANTPEPSLSNKPGHQDFYPPGMSPTGKAAAASVAPASDPRASRRAAAPSAAGPLADDLLPPKASAPAPAPGPAPAPLADRAMQPAPTSEPTMPVPAPYAPAQQYALPVAPAAGVPQSPAFGQAPQAIPAWGAAPVPGTAPFAQPVSPYGAPATGIPGAYPGAWPQPAYPGAMPMAMPMPPSGYPGAMPLAQPMSPYGYGPPAAGIPPLAQPLSPFDPMGGAMNPYGYGGGLAAPPPAPPPQMTPGMPAYGGSADPSLDPMAPVEIPGVPASAFVAPAPAAPFGSGASGGGFAGSAPAAVPLGSAVPSSVQPASAATPLAAADKPTTPLNHRAAEMRSLASTSGSLAARSDDRSQRQILVAGIGGGLALLAIGFGYLIYSANQRNHPAVAQVGPVNPEQNIDPGQAVDPIGRTVEGTLPPNRPTPIPTPTSMPTPVPLPAPMPMPKPPDPAPMPVPMPMPTPTPPEPTPPVPTPTPTPVPSPPPPKPPEPTPAPMPPAVAPPTKAELVALGQACTTAKDALGEQNFAEADKQIAQAETLAKLPEHKAKVARLKEIAGYVKQFRKAVEMAVAGLEAGESFKVGTSAQVVVVETFPDKIIIRAAGVNKTYPLAELPAGLAATIADFKLDGADPVSRVVKGAYYAVQKRDDSLALDKAKTWWEEAQLSGVDTAPIMPFLTDKYDFEKDAGT